MKEHSDMSDAPPPAKSTSTTGCRELSLDRPASVHERDVDLLGALANETRYRIVRLLEGHGEVCVCDIDATLDASQSAISHALAKLHSAGLVERRKEGRWRHYRITPVTRALLSAIDTRRGDTDG